VLINRRHFLGAVAAFTTVAATARDLWSQLIGSKYKFTMDSGPGPETVISGKRCLYFGGTGYFGFQTHPEVLQAAQKATGFSRPLGKLHRFRHTCRSSRLTTDAYGWTTVMLLACWAPKDGARTSTTACVRSGCTLAPH
jgi:hypothetical protein